MNSRSIIYWSTTGLVAAAFTFGGVADLLRLPSVVEGMSALGYPLYFATILGVWKLLGALAVVVPRFPRLKEWAYAGMFFDLSGAMASHLSAGEAAATVVPPLVLLALVLTSWALRPRGRVLGAPLPLPSWLARPAARGSASAAA